MSTVATPDACTCPREAIDLLRRDVLHHRPECPRYAEYKGEPERGTYAGSMVAPAGELPSRHDPDWTELGPCDDCAAVPTEDMREQRDRAAAVARVLESCHEELVRLEMIATSDATDINVLSAAKGYVCRARNILRGRFA